MSYHTSKNESINQHEVEGEQIISYCDYSRTLRQLPENYCLAAYSNNGGWVLAPDLAANPYLVARVAQELQNFDSKYCDNGLKLLSRVTPNAEFRTLEEKLLLLYTGGEKIRALKAYRQITLCSLNEAKLYFEDKINVKSRRRETIN